MTRRRLLVIAYFFPPLAGGGVHRILSFVRHLPAHGWDCTVIAAGAADYWVRDASLLAQVPEGTEVIRVQGGSALAAWLRLFRGGRGRVDQRRGTSFAHLRRLADWWLLPDSYAGWARRARRVAARRLAAGGIDAVLTSSPPDSVHLAGLALARGAGAGGTGPPWVADFRDPWIALHFREPPTRWHRARQQAMERAVLGAADLVLTASRTHLEAIQADPATRPRHGVLLPNGFEPGVEAPAPERPPDDGTFRLVFTGTLSLMPDTATCLEAVAEVLARQPAARRRLRLDLVGPYDADDEDRALALGLKGIVTFHGARPHGDTRAFQRRANLLLLWKPHGPGFATMVPGKLYEYLDAGRPIVALLPPADEAAALVRRGGGEVLPPGDHRALADAIETRYMNDARGRRAPLARPDWLDEHARPRLAARLAAELDALIGRRD